MSWTRWLTHGASQNSVTRRPSAMAFHSATMDAARHCPAASVTLALGGRRIGCGRRERLERQGPARLPELREGADRLPGVRGGGDAGREPAGVDEPSSVRGTSVDAEQLRLPEDVAMTGVRHRLRRGARTHGQLVALARDHVHAEGAGLVEAVPAVE